MGSSQSIDDTILGKSLIGRKFRTKAPICFAYCGYDKKYYIYQWEDRSTLCNPHENSFDLKVKIPIEFKIMGVTKIWGVDSGYSLKISIQILNNFPINTITEIREGTIGHRWVTRHGIDTMESPFRPVVANSYLLTSKLEGGIFSYQMGFKFRRLPDHDYDVNVPCVIDFLHLEKL